MAAERALAERLPSHKAGDFSHVPSGGKDCWRTWTARLSRSWAIRGPLSPRLGRDRTCQLVKSATRCLLRCSEASSESPTSSREPCHCQFVDRSMRWSSDIQYQYRTEFQLQRSKVDLKCENDEKMFIFGVQIRCWMKTCYMQNVHKWRPGFEAEISKKIIKIKWFRVSFETSFMNVRSEIEEFLIIFGITWNEIVGKSS